MSSNYKQELSEAKTFVSEFVTTITGNEMNDAAKQAYFLDNQTNVKKVHNFLITLKGYFDSVCSKENVTEEDARTSELVNALVVTLSETLKNYREGLKTNPDITKEETTVVVNEETVKHAMEEDTSTKKMIEDMQVLSAQKTVQAGEYNYMILVSKTQSYYVYAPTKQELMTAVNQLADATPGATIELFELSYTNVPMKTATKTVYTL